MHQEAKRAMPAPKSAAANAFFWVLLSFVSTKLQSGTRIKNRYSNRAERLVRIETSDQNIVQTNHEKRMSPINSWRFKLILLILLRKRGIAVINATVEKTAENPVGNTPENAINEKPIKETVNIFLEYPTYLSMSLMSKSQFLQHFDKFD